ncbi:tetratricopeptide repeat protein [Herbaspirillum sp. HC18]|nr:tetratricopeptide repeat protein [Herbaspirillum sp. HC18]
MKKTNALLVCGVSLLQACQTPSTAPETAMRIEPVTVVRHAVDTADGMYRLGRHHQNENRLDQAAEAYRGALAKDPDHVEARNALATVYAAQGKSDEAIAEFQAVLQKHPALPHVYNNLGYVHYMKKDYGAAIADFGQAIALDPANPRAFANLALVHEQMGDTAKARAASKHASAFGGFAASSSMLAARPASAAPRAESPAPKAIVKAAEGEPVKSQPSAAAGEKIAIDIANGTRDNALASDIAVRLIGNGFAIRKVSPLKPYTQQRTVILYRDGYHKQALELSRSFAVPPAVVNNTRTRRASDTSTVRLVLGKATMKAVIMARLDELAATP